MAFLVVARRRLLATGCLLLAMGAGVVDSKPASSDANYQLKPMTYEALPLGSIQPAGWLADQMNLMAQGLAGNEAVWFKDVTDNPWLGGTTSYSASHEDLPYWLNGLTNLAYSLNDATLKAQVLKVTNYILKNQSSDGWFGPDQDRNDFVWTRFPVLLAWTQMADADPSMTQQLVQAMYKFLPLMNSILKQNVNPQETTSWAHRWGRPRYADALIVMQWLAEKHPGTMQSEIFQAMQNLHTWGAKWEDIYTESSYIFQDLDTLSYDMNISNLNWPFWHNVNYAQGLKTMGALYRFTNNPQLAQQSTDAVNWSLQYHGSASHTIVGDERLSGNGTNRGSEFCGIVEELFSLEYLHQLFGTPEYADYIERIALNAMASTLNEEHTTHQYINVVNQAQANLNDDFNLEWWNTGMTSNTFNIQPDFPCCTVNHPQGYGKLAPATFLRSPNGTGLVHSLLFPATVTTNTTDGNTITIAADTTYPFGETITYTISATKAFAFLVRVPGWSSSTASNVALNGTAVAGASFNTTTRMITVPIPSGHWKMTFSVLGEPFFTEPRSNGTVAVLHGNVLYALDSGEVPGTLKCDSTDAPAAARWAGSTYKWATDTWNMAIDPSTLQFFPGYSGADPSSLPNPLWKHQKPPSYMTVRACQIDWKLEGNGSVPSLVPLPSARTCTANAQTVTLRPYGSQRARIAEFPTKVITSG